MMLPGLLAREASNSVLMALTAALALTALLPGVGNQPDHLDSERREARDVMPFRHSALPAKGVLKCRRPCQFVG